MQQILSCTEELFLSAILAQQINLPVVNQPTEFEFSGTDTSYRDDTGVHLCSSYKFLEGCAHWCFVHNFQHMILDYEYNQSCNKVMSWHVCLPGSTVLCHCGMPGDVCVCVPNQPVQGQGLGSQCATDGRGGFWEKDGSRGKLFKKADDYNYNDCLRRWLSAFMLQMFKCLKFFSTQVFTYI